MDGFERRTASKKQQIIVTALPLFLTHGIKSVSIATIAKQAHVSQVSIYNYFGSKDHLLKATMDYYIDEIFKEYEEILHAKISFSDKIKQMIFQKGKLATAIHEEIISYFTSSASGEPSYADQLFQEKTLQFFYTLIQQGKDEGYIKKDLSEHAVMIYLQLFKDAMQKKELQEVLIPLTEDIMHLFFYGIIGNKD
ncbi:TetR/AcrR family transcriptional regulator [Gracilibacillus marinus]|jgi:AcrR family transcriptional regulator|uniref:TetR/AcrR family transcriptional regulator n=1 Tax=Gracilibacillus marinus TaxID=630535 RepID=A0ABV8VYB1_9BACI